VNKVALASSPKPVTVVLAEAVPFRPTVQYVGTIAPWTEARIGPQLVSAYVETVRVRPGDVVRRGDVVATLDCRNASAESAAATQQARALEARQEAVAHEAARVGGLLDGGFVSPNEAEMKAADSASKHAELGAARARLQRTALEVDDCVLRAPFDGEVAQRAADPGAFVRPGTALVTVVDRSTVRVTADAPEHDLAAVAPGTPVRIRVLPTGDELAGRVSRRSPAADPGTRTLHFEVDLPNRDRRIPVYTTAALSLEAGEPVPATRIPLTAASVRGPRATLFTVADGKATRVQVPVKGEAQGHLFVETTLAPGTAVVTEGRAQLRDGDAVRAAAPAAPPVGGPGGTP
jgi:RND family efflux transporter MFP subunit